MNLERNQYYYNNFGRENRSLFMDDRRERIQNYANKVDKRNLGGYYANSRLFERNNNDLSSKYGIYSKKDERKSGINFNRSILSNNENKLKKNNQKSGNSTSLFNINKNDYPTSLISRHTSFNKKKINETTIKDLMHNDNWPYGKYETSNIKFYENQKDIERDYKNDNYISNYIPNIGRISSINSEITDKKSYKNYLLNDMNKDNNNKINEIFSKYHKNDTFMESKENINKINSDININKEINPKTDIIDKKKAGDKFKSNIELASMEDYLEKEPDQRERIHEKSNYNKSRSVAPKQNLVDSEISKIINSQIGLNNLGSTCYMNSALQIIIHCKIFIEKIMGFKNSTNSLTNSFLNLCSSIIVSQNKENRNYLSYSYSLNSISPSNFKKLFCLKHSDYMRGQHDSIEFLRTLLDDISKEVNINQNISAYKELKTEGKTKEEQSKDYHNFYISRENSIIVDIFYNQIINIFTCACGFESYSFQKLLDIPLLLPMKQFKVDLESLIKEYFKEEELDWSAKCEKCNKEGLKHLKLIKFSILNEVLIFSLQRFDPFLSKKSNIRVSFKENIDLKDYCDSNLINQKTEYRLCGTINHIGNINYGHYYAYIRIGEIWYEFNDSIVRKCYTMDYDNSSVCVLFYEKV